MIRKTDPRKVPEKSRAESIARTLGNLFVPLGSFAVFMLDYHSGALVWQVMAPVCLGIGMPSICFSIVARWRRRRRAEPRLPPEGESH